ncbi:MAG: 30S ribosomal protein S7 [Anaerolineae bacterium]
MPRRYRPPRREVAPDVRFGSEVLARFINKLMYSGKRSTAEGIVYDAFDLMQARAHRNPLELFEQAVRNVTPVVEVKPRRVGGATYQVPIEVLPQRRQSLALRWLTSAARSRPGKSMAEKLAAELLDAANGEGTAVRRKDETHRMAEANRAFSHYRY